MGRWKLLRTMLSTSTPHHLRRTVLWGVRTALPVFVLIRLSPPSRQRLQWTPLLVAISVLGVVALTGSLELAYRRVFRERHRMQQRLQMRRDSRTPTTFA